MSIAKRYNPEEIEQKWYQHWEDQGYFHSEPDERESFSIVIPPPNVTGVLHMGHMLNNTVQDILIRKARLDGKNACWVPGTDHASIATEAKVVRMLREKGIKKGDISREQFLKYAWEWREKYGGIILQQLRKLGASCDWERTAFTMDETRSKAVLHVFVDLYNKGKIYRGLRMINWDPQAQTVLSNEEVIYGDEDGQLYHVKYPVDGEDGKFVTIATTRPETILGDTAIAVHPDDERYRDMLGKHVIVPLVNRKIPVIADSYVDIEFGTGALKITPAHDPNDYEIGLRHNLEVIDILNPDGTISEEGQHFVGEDRNVARDLMADALEEQGLLVGKEVYRHSVGRSERTHAVVEPRLSKQWYVDMEALAKPALDAVNSDEVKFFPEKYKNMYRHWMENIRDWCISRQLWWGQRIPAFYIGEGENEKVFVAPTKEAALDLARKELGDDIDPNEMRQDEDVVDTWFSSWLWPITVFDGFENENELNYYYPTSVLVTGWDIIFLWVARMIMAGYEWKDLRPFDHVYFTGMVRDKKGRKMSKSLGNSPDALKLIEDFGADGVRFGILSSSPAGGDLLFDENLCEQGRNFCNKIWNALRLVKGWEIDENLKQDERSAFAVKWIESRISAEVAYQEDKFGKYRLSDALMNLYTLIRGDFCSWYLEMIKPDYGKPIDRLTYDKTITYFRQICSMLHPFMPFITEEVWHQLIPGNTADDCIVSSYPKPAEADMALLNQVAGMEELVTRIRELRNANQVAQSKAIDLYIGEGELLSIDDLEPLHVVCKLANVENAAAASEMPDDAIPFVAAKQKFFAVLPIERNLDEERERLNKELEYYQGFVQTVMKKLGNERFVQNAPEAVVEKERKKLADGEEKIRMIEESIAHLGE